MTEEIDSTDKQIAEQGREAVVVTVFADAGERYLGERFWTP